MTDLEIDGVTDGTVSDYASSLGKKIIYSDVGISYKDEYLDGTTDFHISGDGTLYEMISASSPDTSGQISLTCTGSAYEPDAAVADHAYGAITLFNKSDSEVYECFIDDDRALSSVGIKISDIQMTETQLGLYAKITWTGEGDTSFEIKKADGTALDTMPDYMTSETFANEDGSHTSTLVYQKPDDTAQLALAVTNADGEVDVWLHH